MSPGTDADVSDVLTGATGPEMSNISRRRFIAGTAGVAAMTGTAGCADVLGSSSGSKEEVTIVLTPENPTDIKKDYMPMQRYLEDQILSTSGSIYALWELQNAGLDLGQAPGNDTGADFTGNWSNHKAAIEQLINGKVDACSTWGGNGMAYVPESDVPDRVMEKTAYRSELGTKSPALDVFLYSEPIPKQPVINRSTWDSPMKGKIENTLYNANDDVMNEYKPDDYEGTMPFTTLNETSKSDYQPVIKRVNDLGIDLTQEE